MDEFVDLVQTAKAQGIYTVVCDGHTDGPAKPFADASYDVDVRDTDDIVEICKREDIDGIIASYSDLLAECMVKIADKAGLPCYARPERFRYLREKTLMKHMFRELGVSTPQSVTVHRNSIEEDVAHVGFPCVVKPANGYGSHGVFLLKNTHQIADYYDRVASYSSFDYIIAEKYCAGHEFNMMCWVVDGDVVTLSIADRETSTQFEHVIPHVSRIVYPSRLIHKVLDEAHDIVKRIADYVGISTGPLSMQFFYSEEEGLQVCEVAGRPFGYEHELLTLACGLSVEELLINQVYNHGGLKAQLNGHTPFHPHQSAGIYFHGYEGTVADISSVLEAEHDPYVENVTIYYQPGERIDRHVGSKPYVIRFYLKAEDRASLDDATERLYQKIRVLDPNGKNLLYSSQMSTY